MAPLITPRMPPPAAAEEKAHFQHSSWMDKQSSFDLVAVSMAPLIMPRMPPPVVTDWQTFAHYQYFSLAHRFSWIQIELH